MIFPEYSWLIYALGWTLLHTIWQGIAVVSILIVVLQLMKKASANVRYIASCIGLFLLTFLMVATFINFAIKGNASTEILSKNVDKNSKVEQTFPTLAVNDLAKKKDFQLSNDSQINQEQKTLFGNWLWIEKNIVSTFPILVGIWLFGVIFQLLKMGFGLRHLHQLKTKYLDKVSNELSEKFERLKGDLKINQAVKLLQSAKVSTPIAIGWLRPIVVIPISAFTHLSPQELETVIKHELIHIKRYDYLVNIFQSFAECVLFYHPAVWWISSVIRNEREFACDDVVISTDENIFTYAHALANLEQTRLATNHNSSKFVLSAVGSKGNLTQRIKRIIEPKHKLHSPYSIFSISPLIIFLLSSSLLIYAFGTQFNPTAETSINSIKTKKIAVGFVSIPFTDNTTDKLKTSEETARLLITKLNSRKIPAIGFIHGENISDGQNIYSSKLKTIRMWQDAGLEIGIGGFKHIRFYDTPYDKYVANVLENEKIVKQILSERNPTLRFFSYPFLNIGKNQEDYNKFESFLKDQKLSSIKYTFDNQEWMYSFAYDTARKKNDTKYMKQIRTEFIDYMAKMLVYYEEHSNNMFGRNIPQTLVLTPSRLVADTADELFGMFENNGYKFVSMGEAQTDTAYQHQENFVNTRSGITWFERIEARNSRNSLIEPKVSKSVLNIWNLKKMN